MVKSYKLLPLPRNYGRKTDTIKSAYINGAFIRLYSIRLFQIQTGYARGGEPGRPGAIVGYGVSVDDRDGCCVVDVQSRSLGESDSTYAVVVGWATEEGK